MVSHKGTAGSSTRPKRRRYPLPRGRWLRLAVGACLAVAAVAGCAGSPSGGAGSSPSGRHSAFGSNAGEGGSSQQTGSGAALWRAGKAGSRPGAKGGANGLGVQSGILGGALFGGNTYLAQADSFLGRRLAIVRVYYRIGEPFPFAMHKPMLASGSTVLVSLDSVPGHGGPSYASIAAGNHDGAIRMFLQDVERAAVTYHLGAIYISFEHEANNPRHNLLGTPAGYVQAWDHIHALAVAMHLDWNQGGRLHWVMILSNRGYLPMAGRPSWEMRYGDANAFWPGAGEVDAVGVDGYYTDGCLAGSQNVSPTDLFGPVISYAQAHGNLPVFIAEWGIDTNAPPGAQPTFIHEMQNFVTANPEVAAALYWSGHAVHGPCNFTVQSTASTSALAAMGLSAGLQGRVPSAS